MKTFLIERDALSDFTSAWPCHGFPDELDAIKITIDDNGDLVDLEAFDEQDNMIDTADFDGPALVAVVDDARGRP